jgi:prevent-host-death family protein
MKKVGIGELRKHVDNVLDLVEAGEDVIVTRSRREVAKLVPLHGRQLSSQALVARFARLEPVNLDSLRTDLDTALNSTL